MTQILFECITWWIFLLVVNVNIFLFRFHRRNRDVHDVWHNLVCHDAPYLGYVYINVFLSLCCILRFCSFCDFVLRLWDQVFDISCMKYFDYWVLIIFIIYFQTTIHTIYHIPYIFTVLSCIIFCAIPWTNCNTINNRKRWTFFVLQMALRTGLWSVMYEERMDSE